MRPENFPGNPREALRHSDNWTRRMALASMVREPKPTDRELFDEFIDNDDPATALLAFLGLKKLLPAPARLNRAWKELFGESVDILVRRACHGPMQLRLAALKTLAFAPDFLRGDLIEPVLLSLEEPLSHQTVALGQSPDLVLVSGPKRFFLPDGFALILASLPKEQKSINLLSRELENSDPARLLPALLALQIRPTPELTDQLLGLTRSLDGRIALEASRALASCGGERMFPVLLALLKQMASPARKAGVLPLVAATGREEVWPVIKTYFGHKDRTLKLAAIHAAAIFPAPAEEKLKLFKNAMKNEDAAISCVSAAFAWQHGSMKSLNLLESALFDNQNKELRLYAAHSLSKIAADTAIIMLSSRFDSERSGDVIRQMILSLRKLLPEVKNNIRMHELLYPWLKRLIKSSNPFKRSQCAVLCGMLGKSCEDLLVQALEKEHHPHVIASALSALGKIGMNRILIYSRFNDHPDPRVRANMIDSMLCCSHSATSYFGAALKDPSPRVRATAAKNLFLLGQLDIVAELNRMLLIPSPVSVLSGCYGLGKCLRIQPPALEADHPLGMAITRKIKTEMGINENEPELLSDSALPEVFRELAIAGGDTKKMLWILEEKHKKYPTSFAIKRLLASLYIVDGHYERAFNLLYRCIDERPAILANLFDAYRIALRTGNLDAATDLGKKTRDLYHTLLAGCIQLCRSIRGKGAEMMFEKLHQLQEPSMNLYNAMIQLKVIEHDKETVLDLLGELALARPTNYMVVRRLTEMLTDTHSELNASLAVFIATLHP
jgi:HEAT repeat protein